MQLTPEQASLYAATVADMLSRIEDAADDISRRGLVLATLAKLKQVCNHPAHLLGDGSRARPYQVRIGVLPLTTAQWRRVESALAARALFRAKLLAGEMPQEIEEVFAGCGTPLFSRLASDLDMRCSCPDWEVPCKHLAAVCYVLAEEFDRDPFAMLAWRGQGRDELLAALRRVRAPGSGPAPGPLAVGGPMQAPDPPSAGGPAGHGSQASGPGGAAAGVRGGVLVRPAEPGPAARAGRVVRLRRFRPAAAHVPAAAVKVRGQDLADVLAPAYRWLAEADPGE